jgi:hypothetical protein
MPFRKRWLRITSYRRSNALQLALRVGAEEAPITLNQIAQFPLRRDSNPISAGGRDAR